MRFSKASFMCVCLLGLTQVVWTQEKAMDESHEKGIPGYLDPHTGTFTPRIQHSAVNATAPPLSGSTILFREQFNITITNYDQNTSDTVACEAEIDSSGDANGDFYDYATVFATRSGNTFTCDVPILTLWTLQTPNTDSITAYVYVDFLQGITVGSAKDYWEVRYSDQPNMTLTVPSNGQTVINSLSFTM